MHDDGVRIYILQHCTIVAYLTFNKCSLTDLLLRCLKCLCATPSTFSRDLWKIWAYLSQSMWRPPCDSGSSQVLEIQNVCEASHRSPSAWGPGIWPQYPLHDTILYTVCIMYRYAVDKLQVMIPYYTVTIYMLLCIELCISFCPLNLYEFVTTSPVEALALGPFRSRTTPAEMCTALRFRKGEPCGLSDPNSSMETCRFGMFWDLVWCNFSTTVKGYSIILLMFQLQGWCCCTEAGSGFGQGAVQVATVWSSCLCLLYLLRPQQRVKCLAMMLWEQGRAMWPDFFRRLAWC